jgi:23S rRNA pseudouridine1911/1915/1917 synthase
VAKTPEAHVRIAAQFRDRVVHKQYVAVARGRLPRKDGIIECPIGRHPRERQRMSVRSRRGRVATTRYRVVERYAGATFVRLFPTTGRTHQLRVHLTAIGHPVVGDRVYGRGRAMRRGSEEIEQLLAAFPRQALHAETIAFVHPRSDDRIEIEAPLAQDLQDLLSALRAYGRVTDAER